jgi:Sec-independent protein translocase protein TatA
MLNIGIVELLFIIFFLILFVRPDDIPKIAKNIGLIYRKISRYFYNIKYELSEIESDLLKEEKQRKEKSKTDEVPRSLKRTKK